MDSYGKKITTHSAKFCTENTNHVLDVVSFYPHKSHSQVLQLGDMNFRASRLVYLIIQVKSNIVHDESLIVILDFFFTIANL